MSDDVAMLVLCYRLAFNTNSVPEAQSYHGFLRQNRFSHLLYPHGNLRCKGLLWVGQ